MAGWDATARLLGIVRFRDDGDVDGALGALVRGGIGLVEVTLDTPGALDAVATSAATCRGTRGRPSPSAKIGSSRTIVSRGRRATSAKRAS